MPATPENLLERLSLLGVRHTTFAHAPVMTVEESRRLRGDIAGLHAKNLFLKDKKGGLWLVVAGEDTPVDLKALRKRLGLASLSFAGAETLYEILGVEPGSVTPFAVINDAAAQVRVVLDQALAQGAAVNFHPLVNSRTTTVSGAGLLAFLRATGHEPLVMDFAAHP